ncbi:hypothetical protein KSS87_000714 [Heliosperma pusillum]|nr:hypothetical protein KSS87_000714 [Heliosperma pusillum]
MCSKMQEVIRPQIILFGDSITQQSFNLNGWGSSLADNFSRKADVLNRGYGGYTTRWALFLLHHIFPLGSATPPVGVTIFFGANDAALPGRNSDRQHTPMEEYKENLRKMVHHLKECSPSMVVVLITPPPIDEEGRMEYARSLYGEKAMTQPERTNETTGEYAMLCVSLAKELGVPHVNLWSKMQETEGWQKKYLRDGLHLTAEGNEVVYQEVLQVFNQAGLSSSVMPFDFPHHSKIDPKNPEKAFSTHPSQ